MRTTYGYARVSTIGQTLEAQLDGLKAAGCQRIFREKVSGARADRRELNKLLRKLQAGDVVVVTRIDRLARATFDLFAIVKSIVDRKAQFRSLAESRGPTLADSLGRGLRVYGPTHPWYLRRAWMAKSTVVEVCAHIIHNIKLGGLTAAGFCPPTSLIRPRSMGMKFCCGR